MLIQIRKYISGVTLLALMMIKCTIGPTAGIETGNPRIIASIQLSLDMFNSNEWNPASYLINGDAELNPEMCNDRPIVMLAKKTAQSELGSGINQDSLRTVPDSSDTNSYQIIQQYGSVIIIDTVYVRDTLTNLSDSVSTSSDSSISVVKVFSVVLSGSFEHRDTVALTGADTFFNRDGSVSYIIPQVSVPSSSSWKLVSASDKISGTQLTYEYYRDGSARVQNVDISKDLFVMDTAITTITRDTKLTGGLLSEVYRDGDGDGQLGLSNSSSRSIIKLAANYVLSDSITRLVVDFDGGRDGSFELCEDNRIQMLQRTKFFKGAAIEEVSYLREKALFGDDTLSLTVAKAGIDTVESTVKRYVCVSGVDKLDHRENRLKAVTLVALYRNTEVKKITTIVTVDTALGLNQKAKRLSLSVTYDFGKGLQGVLEGEVDCVSRRFKGRYAEGGKEYGVYFDDLEGVFDLEAVLE